MKMRVLSLVVLAVVIGLAYAWTQGLPPFAGNDSPATATTTGGARAAKTVAAAPVAASQITDRLSAVGTVRARESIVVTAEASGIVREVLFEHGATAAKGDVLVRLDGAEARAELAAARAELTNAQRAFDRASQLRRNGTIAQPVYDEAAAALEAARSNVALAELKLEKRTVRAPFAGRLGFRQVSPGSYLTPGEEITTLDDLDVVHVDFAVPEENLAAVAPGQRVALISAAHPDRTFTGTVLTVGSRVDPVSRQARVRAEVPNEDDRLRPGQMVAVEVAVAERPALMVPAAAVVAVGYQHFVFVLNDADKAERRTVTLGTRTGERVEITGGLQEGERLVVEGAAKLDGGDAVKVVPALAVDASVAAES